METVTLKINGDLADKAKQLLTTAFGKGVFANEKTGTIQERVTTFEEACEELGIDPKTVFDSSKDSLDEIAYKKIKIIVLALNEGWFPNWDNSNEYKYYPWFKMSGSGLSYSDCDNGHSFTYVGSRLVFKSKDLAIYAGKQFTSIYNDFFTIK